MTRNSASEWSTTRRSGPARPTADRRSSTCTGCGLLLRIIGLLLQVVSWFTRRVDSHRHRAMLHTLPVNSYYEVGLTHAEVEGDMGDAALRSMLPGFVVSTVEFVDAHFIMPVWSTLHHLRTSAVGDEWRGVSQRPAFYLVYALSTAVYGALNTVLAFLTALTGQKRSWVTHQPPLTAPHMQSPHRLADSVCSLCSVLCGQVNVFDDSFDVQYLCKDVQPVWSTATLTPTISQSGIGRTLLTPDLLYPYDLYPLAGFTPVVTPLDVVMALLSKLGYEETEPHPGTVQQVCDEWKVDYVSQFLYDDSTARLDGPFADVLFQSRAFLFRYDSAAVVCFRGTYPTAALQWLTDFAAQQVVYPGQDKLSCKEAVRVHRGFFSALGLPVLGDPLYPETMFTSILRQLSEMQPPVSRLYVTGHSLGAALATMFSYALKAQWSGGRPTRNAAGVDGRSTHRYRMFNAKSKTESTADMPATKAAAPAAPASKNARALKVSSAGTSGPARRGVTGARVAGGGGSQDGRPVHVRLASCGQRHVRQRLRPPVPRPARAPLHQPVRHSDAHAAAHSQQRRRHAARRHLRLCARGRPALHRHHTARSVLRQPGRAAHTLDGAQHTGPRAGRLCQTHQRSAGGTGERRAHGEDVQQAARRSGGGGGASGVGLSN